MRLQRSAEVTTGWYFPHRMKVQAHNDCVKHQGKAWRVRGGKTTRKTMGVEAGKLKTKWGKLFHYLGFTPILPARCHLVDKQVAMRQPITARLVCQRSSRLPDNAPLVLTCFIGSPAPSLQMRHCRQRQVGQGAAAVPENKLVQIKSSEATDKARKIIKVTLNSEL